jgi:aryl-alcohol dehydrogenase-like predicted oxidoreductase
MQKRGNRDEIVLATKYTSLFKNSWEENPIHANYCGNSAKSLKVSFEHSLKKLQTDYIDLLYVHWWYRPSLPPL